MSKTHQRKAKPLFIMKNLFSFSILIVVLLFTSCSKDSAFLPELDLDAPPMIVSDSKTSFQASDTAPYQSIGRNNKTIQLQAITSVYSASTDELIVLFSGNGNYTSTTPLATQTLDFVNSNSFPHFLAQSYTASNGFLHIIFDTSGSNLTGLNLENTQEIIIEDEVIN